LAWWDQFECEVLVVATGFRSQIPGECLPAHRRFPEMRSWYSRPGNTRVHYLGWLMHAQDFQKGAGGFTSGFRYLIRNLMDQINLVDFGVDFPFRRFSKEEVVQHIIRRVQIADDILIMQDGTVLRDVILPLPDGSSYRYYEGVPYQFKKMWQRSDAIYLFFGWGDARTTAQVFDGRYRYSDTHRLINLFLHPILETQGLRRHIQEDLEMAWRHAPYLKVVESSAREVLNGNLTAFSPVIKHPYRRQAYETPLPNATDDYAQADLRSEVDQNTAKAIIRAVHDKSEVNLQALRQQIEVRRKEQATV
jgi:hypothetical protein